jgi:hypothetical protein
MVETKSFKNDLGNLQNSLTAVLVMMEVEIYLRNVEVVEVSVNFPKPWTIAAVPAN